jgi:Protein of unknown function (DUF3667)
MCAAAIPADPHICRNCGAPAPGKFCASCGQETDTRLPTLRKFMHDATGRVISFDSRMWRTLFALVAKPGFLTREYFDGRRRRYVRPTRLFLVMSVILFGLLRLEVPPIPFDERTIIIDAPEKASRPAGAKSDRVQPDKPAAPAQRAPSADAATEEGFNLSLDKDLNFVVEGSRNPFSNMVRERIDRFNRLSKTEKSEQILNGVLRYGPYAVFVLLPAFAWLQQVSYLGRARRYPGRPRKYIEHLVFAAHIHTLLFLVLIVTILLPWDLLNLAIWAWAVYYIIRARNEIYRGSRVGGILRGLLVAVMYAVLFAFAMIALLFSAILIR